MKKIRFLLLLFIPLASAAQDGGPSLDLRKTIRNFCQDCFVQNNVSRMPLYYTAELNEWLAANQGELVSDGQQPINVVTNKGPLLLDYDIVSYNMRDVNNGYALVEVHEKENRGNRVLYTLNFTVADGKWLIRRIVADTENTELADRIRQILR